MFNRALAGRLPPCSTPSSSAVPLSPHVIHNRPRVIRRQSPANNALLLGLNLDVAELEGVVMGGTAEVVAGAGYAGVAWSAL
jgi:hypothetical protein